MKKLALHWQILIGMVLGVLFGFAAVQFSGGKELVTDWVKPFGTIFINSLKLIAVPLIVASLIMGIAGLKDISKLEIYDGSTERFCAIGDENGLFICINKQSKNWFPTNEKAYSSPFKIDFENNGTCFSFEFKDGVIESN